MPWLLISVPARLAGLRTDRTVTASVAPPSASQVCLCQHRSTVFKTLNFGVYFTNRPVQVERDVRVFRPVFFNSRSQDQSPKSVSRLLNRRPDFVKR